MVVNRFMSVKLSLAMKGFIQLMTQVQYVIPRYF